jgi:transketolase
MFKNLSSGTKISITRSIKTSFEQYMASIQWEEDKFNIENFIQSWRSYITEHASWYKNLDEQTKNDPEFHQELALKINETIEKVLSEDPSADQIEALEEIQKAQGTDYDFSCKAEAKYLLEKLVVSSKKK